MLHRYALAASRRALSGPRPTDPRESRVARRAADAVRRRIAPDVDDVVLLCDARAERDAAGREPRAGCEGCRVA